MPSELVELRLKHFKSVQDAKIALKPLTLLVGRNGSGKSNILDALAVLAALATGSDLRDALDGGRDGPVVRGGSQGCAPIGADTFEVGCTARSDETVYHLDVRIQTAPSLQIASERLWTTRSGTRAAKEVDLIKSEAPSPHSADIWVKWTNAKSGRNPIIPMRANQLLTSQVAARVPAVTEGGQQVHRGAEAVLEAISGIFMLDPVPHQMREYVPEKDSKLRRYADNLSAVLKRLAAEATVGEQLLDMTRSLSEAQVSRLDFVSSALGDVMVTIEERLGGQKAPVPARLMSDGTLRFLAIAAAMLDTPDEDGASRLLVVEELENGLHPSQAALLIERLQAAAAQRRIRTLATTHSPAILDAMPGANHDSVVVVSRDTDGWSQATALTDFPDYFSLVGRRNLGAIAVRNELRPSPKPEPGSRSLASIFGYENAR